MPTTRPVLVRTAVIAVIALVAIVVLAPAVGLWRSGSPTNTVLAAETGNAVNGITVEGLGRVTISPDLATITVAVQAQAPKAAEAQAKASASMTKVIAAVKGQGVADADIATQWISLEPQYDYKNDGSTAPKVTGYLASQSLSVKVRTIANVGPIIDSAVAAGANQVSGISFSLADPTAAATQARSAAIANAKARATELAQAAGVSLGAAVSIVELSAPNPIPYEYDRAAQAADGATPVQPGTLEIEVDVQVTFAIG